jgi:hypothetical protein
MPHDHPLRPQLVSWNGSPTKTILLWISFHTIPSQHPDTNMAATAQYHCIFNVFLVLQRGYHILLYQHD